MAREGAGAGVGGGAAGTVGAGGVSVNGAGSANGAGGGKYHGGAHSSHSNPAAGYDFEIEAVLRKATGARGRAAAQRQQRTVHSILEQLQALAYRQAALEGSSTSEGSLARAAPVQPPHELPSAVGAGEDDGEDGGGNGPGDISAARLLPLPVVLETIGRLQAWLIGLVVSGTYDLGELVSQLYELAESSPKRAQELLHPLVLELQAGVFARLEERGEATLSAAAARVTQPQLAQLFDAVEVYGPDALHGAAIASRATVAASDCLVALSHSLLPTLVEALAARLERAAGAEERVREQGLGSEGAAATAVAAWAAQIALLRAASQWSFGLIDEERREATAAYLDAVSTHVLPGAQRSYQCRGLVECVIPALATVRAGLEAAGAQAAEDLLLATDEPLQRVWLAEAPLRTAARSWLSRSKLTIEASTFLALLAAHAPAHELGARWREKLIKGLVQIVKRSDAGGRARALVAAAEYVRSVPRCLLEHRLPLRDSWEADVEALLSEGLMRRIPRFPWHLPAADVAALPRNRAERADYEFAAREAQCSALCALVAQLAWHDADIPIAVGVLRQALASGAAGKTSTGAYCNAMFALAAMLQSSAVQVGDYADRCAAMSTFARPSESALSAASDAGLAEYVVQALKEGGKECPNPRAGLFSCLSRGPTHDEVLQRRLAVARSALRVLPLPLLSFTRPGGAKAALDATGMLALSQDVHAAEDALEALLRALPLLEGELLTLALEWLLRVVGERAQTSTALFEQAMRTLCSAVEEIAARAQNAPSRPSSRPGSFSAKHGGPTQQQAEAEEWRRMRLRIEGAGILALVRPEPPLQRMGALLIKRMCAPELTANEAEARALAGAEPLAPRVFADAHQHMPSKVGWSRQLELLIEDEHSLDHHRWALEWAWAKLAALRLWDQHPTSDSGVDQSAGPPWSVWLNQWRFVCLTARQQIPADATWPPRASQLTVAWPWEAKLMSASAIDECLVGAWKRLCMPEDNPKTAAVANAGGMSLRVSEAAVGVALRTSLEQLHPSCHGLLLQCMRMHAEDARAAARGRRGRTGYSGEIRGARASAQRGPRSYAFEPQVVAMLAHVFGAIEDPRTTQDHDASDTDPKHARASKAQDASPIRDTAAVQLEAEHADTLSHKLPLHSSVEVSLQEVVYAWLQAEPSPMEARDPAFRCNMLVVATQYLAHAKELRFNVPRSQMLVAITSTWLQGEGGLGNAPAGDSEGISTAEAIQLRRSALRALCALLALGPSQTEHLGTAAAQFTQEQLESGEGSELYDEASACLAMLLQNEPYRLGYFLLASFGDMRATGLEAVKTTVPLGQTLRSIHGRDVSNRHSKQDDAAAANLASAHLRAIVWCAELDSEGHNGEATDTLPAETASQGWLRARRLADGEGIYVCLLHLCSPAAERRELALRVLRALLRSMSPNNLLPLPLPPFDQAPPEAHIQAAAATSAVIAAARPLCAGVVLREAVALHTSLPLTLLPAMLTVLKPWAACFPRMVSESSKGPAKDATPAARAALLSLFDMVRLCGWPSREAPLLRPLWAVLMPEPSSPTVLKEACANFIARFLTEAHAAGGGVVTEQVKGSKEEVARSAFTSLPRVNSGGAGIMQPSVRLATPGTSGSGAWWLQAPIIMLDDPLHLGGWWVRGERRNALTERRLAKLALSYALAAPAAPPLIGALVAQLRLCTPPAPITDPSVGWSLEDSEVAWEASGGFEPIKVTRRERSTIALLAEAAYEHGELLLPHLPKLLHASLAVRGIGDKGDEAATSMAKRTGTNLIDTVWSADAPGRTLVSFGIHSLVARRAPTEGRRARAEALLGTLLPSPATGTGPLGSPMPDTRIRRVATEKRGNSPRPATNGTLNGHHERHPSRSRPRDAQTARTLAPPMDDPQTTSPEPFVLISPVGKEPDAAPTELSLNPEFVCALFDAFAPSYPSLAHDWAHESLGWAFMCTDERAVLASMRVLAAAEMRQPLSEADLRGVSRLLLSSLRAGHAGAAGGALEIFEAVIPHLWAAADKLDDVSIADRPRRRAYSEVSEADDGSVGLLRTTSDQHASTYYLSMNEWMRIFDLLSSSAVAALCMSPLGLHDQALALATDLLLGGGRRAGNLRRRRALRPRALASRMRDAWKRAAAEMGVTMDAAVTTPFFRSLLSPSTAKRGLTMLEIYGEVYADSLPAGNRLVILVLLVEAALAITDDAVDATTRSRRARHVARFVSRCGFVLPEVHAAFEHLEIGGMAGTASLGERQGSSRRVSEAEGFLRDFFSGFSLSFPEDESWRFALRSVVVAAGHGVPRWRNAFMRLLGSLLAARAHAWTRGDFAAVAELLGSQGGGAGGDRGAAGRPASSHAGGSDSADLTGLLEDLRVQLLEHAPFDVTARVFDALGGQTGKSSSAAVVAAASLRPTPSEVVIDQRMDVLGPAHEPPALCESWFDGLKVGAGASPAQTQFGGADSMSDILSSVQSAASRTHSFSTVYSSAPPGSTGMLSSPANSEDGDDADGRYFPFDSDIEDDFDDADDEDPHSLSGAVADVSANEGDDCAGLADSQELPLSARSSMSIGTFGGTGDSFGDKDEDYGHGHAQAPDHQARPIVGHRPPLTERTSSGFVPTAPTHRRTSSNVSTGSGGHSSRLTPLIVPVPTRMPKQPHRQRPAHRRSASAGPEVFNQISARGKHFRKPRLSLASPDAAAYAVQSGRLGLSPVQPMLPPVKTVLPKRSPPPSPQLVNTPERGAQLQGPAEGEEAVGKDGAISPTDVEAWVPVVENALSPSQLDGPPHKSSFTNVDASIAGEASAVVNPDIGDDSEGGELSGFVF